jgi:hypothetical protein
MTGWTGDASVLAVVNKHHLAGIVAIVVGAVVVVIGALRFFGRTVRSMSLAVVGLVVVVIGVLLYFRKL